ncbi:MAG: HAD-IA family hydrolase [Dehalococcoidia bacterium]|jgi:putative hydrolase of the HAD superfamily
MKVRAVIFDLGYTMWAVDYGGEPEAYGRLRRRLVNELGEPIPPAKALRDAVAAVFLREGQAYDGGRLAQKPTEQVFREAFEALGLDAPEPLREMAEETLSYGIRYTVEPDTVETLCAFKQRGLRVGVVSNTYQSSRSLAKSLRRFGLLGSIDALVVSSEVGWGKPHPAIFEEALRRLGVQSEEAVFVGDTVLADIKGSQALGMKAVLTWEYRQEDPGDAKPDLVVDKLSQVVKYVDRLNAEG